MTENIWNIFNSKAHYKYICHNDLPFIDHNDDLRKWIKSLFNLGPFIGVFGSSRELDGQ